MTSRHSYFLLIILLMAVLPVKAQEEPIYTNYINNPLEINPAIPGTIDGLNLNFLTRQQWVGMDGYPASYSFGAHMPYPEHNFGVGLNLMTERVGPVKNTTVMVSYAYKIQVMEDAQLSMGLNAGLKHYNAAISGLDINDVNDHHFQSDLNRTSPTFGIGGYLYAEKYFAGISSPNLIHVKLEEEYRESDAPYNPSVYLMGGYKYKFDPEWQFLPSALITLKGGAPATADITARFLYQNRYYMGTHYRIGDAAGVFFNIKITDFLEAGYAFDFTLNKLANVNNGTHEFIVAYKLHDLW